jgi:hypothetical protein
VALYSKYTRALTYENLYKLEEKMQPAIDAARQRLAESTEGNLGGVHWTSGDVPFNYDVFPLREVSILCVRVCVRVRRERVCVHVRVRVRARARARVVCESGCVYMCTM